MYTLDIRDHSIVVQQYNRGHRFQVIHVVYSNL